jgi:hypothetical protein
MTARLTIVPLGDRLSERGVQLTNRGVARPRQALPQLIARPSDLVVIRARARRTHGIEIDRRRRLHDGGLHPRLCLLSLCLLVGEEQQGRRERGYRRAQEHQPDEQACTE